MAKYRALGLRDLVLATLQSDGDHYYECTDCSAVVVHRAIHTPVCPGAKK